MLTVKNVSKGDFFQKLKNTAHKKAKTLVKNTENPKIITTGFNFIKDGLLKTFGGFSRNKFDLKKNFCCLIRDLTWNTAQKKDQKLVF